MKINCDPISSEVSNLREHKSGTSKNHIQGGQPDTRVIGGMKKKLRHCYEMVVDCLVCCIKRKVDTEREDVYPNPGPIVQGGTKSKYIPPATSCTPKSPMRNEANKDAISRRKRSYNIPRGPLSTASMKDFKVISQIGSGGMGTIFEARLKRRWYMPWRFPDLGTVALKVIEKNLHSKPYMEQEARNHVRFSNHANVPTVYGCFQDRDYICLIMEKVNGPDLDTYMNNEKKVFSEEQALEVTKQVLEVLSYMHAHRCAHLDVKTSNVMFASSPIEKTPLPRVLLIDFGLSLGHHSGNGVYDIVKIGPLGTPGQSAPEVGHFSGYYAAGPADMWSVGCLLFDMLSGKLPYEGDTFSDIAIAAQKADDVFTSTYFTQLGCRTMELLRTLLSVNPDERPSADDSLVLITHILQNVQPRRNVESISITLH